jgi:hypothetical protein
MSRRDNRRLGSSSDFSRLAERTDRTGTERPFIILYTAKNTSHAITQLTELGVFWELARQNEQSKKEAAHQYTPGDRTYGGQQFQSYQLKQAPQSPKQISGRSQKPFFPNLGDIIIKAAIIGPNTAKTTLEYWRTTDATCGDTTIHTF